MSIKPLFLQIIRIFAAFDTMRQNRETKRGRSMNTKIKVLIADSCNDYRRLVASRFQDDLDIELVGSTADGREALRLTREARPDVIVLDILLEHLDGLDVLRRIKEMDLRVSSIVASAFYKDSVISETSRLGASYFMRKPFGTEILLERIRHAAKHTDSVVPPEVGQLEFEAAKILRELGTPAHVRGYRFLRHGIALVAWDVRFLDAVTGKLYPRIAENFNTTHSQVERCIRSVIETTWDDGDPQVLQKFFGYTVSNRKRKPTNSEFIATIADLLSLQQKYGREEDDLEHIFKR